MITEDISLKEFESTIGWKIVGTRAYMESTQHFPPLLEEPSQNVVFSIVFKREFIFDEISGVTKRPLGNDNQMQVSYKVTTSILQLQRKEVFPPRTER